MKANGLQRRSYSEAHRMRYSQKHLNIDLAEIVRLAASRTYFEEQLISLIEVGTRLGVCSFGSYYRAKMFGSCGL